MDKPHPDQTTTKALLRFLSVEDCEMNLPAYQPPTYTRSLASKEFLLKIIELIIGCCCAGIYSEAVKIMTDNITSMCFPNVVFGSFIIITGVISISFMLGYEMPATLIRIFNSLGMILYFISATVTFHRWTQKSNVLQTLQMAKNLLLIQSFLSYVNAIVYGLDMFLSIQKAIICD